MAGASDKARFYLEQSVPELREWERRGVFSKAEISQISSKRSSFEHTLNARGSSAADYARYIQYETNLDALRRERVKRLGIKTTAYTGQRNLLQILDRGTRKFPGDISLWMQYINTARQQKANKRLTRVFTDVLRLHPTKPALWILVAKHAMEVQGDVTAARSYMQRGLRFCKRSRKLYIEYAKLEMLYIAKLHARWTVLGLTDAQKSATEQKAVSSEEEGDVIGLAVADHEATDEAASEATLVKSTVLDQLKASGILDGAIPIAIFDAAMQQFPSDLAMADRFVEALADFNVPCVAHVGQHVFNHVNKIDASSAVAQSLYCRLPIMGVESDSLAFAEGLRSVLARIDTAVQNTTEPASLAETLTKWRNGLMLDPGMPSEFETILRHTVRRLERQSNKG